MQQQQALQLARKAQAAARWSQQTNTPGQETIPINVTVPAITVPTSAVQVPPVSSMPPSLTVPPAISVPPVIAPISAVSVAHKTAELPALPLKGRAPMPHTATAMRKIPKRPSSASSASPFTRGAHFHSCTEENSSDEEIEAPSNLPVVDECCKELNAENKALRQRLEKLHKRLTIACKIFNTSNIY